MKKHLVAAAIAGTAGLAGLSTAGIVAAQSGPSTDRPSDGLVSALAAKFHLNTADVQKFFDEHHEQREQVREATIKEQLSELVADGTLTQAQADKLLAKRAEIQQQREAHRSSTQDKTRSNMRGEMDIRMNDLHSWAEDNGIPMKYLRFVMGAAGGPHGEMQMHMSS